MRWATESPRKIKPRFGEVSILRDSVVAVVVHTRPRAILLAMMTMRKSIHGFPFLSYMSAGLRLAGAPIKIPWHRFFCVIIGQHSLQILANLPKTNSKCALHSLKFSFRDMKENILWGILPVKKGHVSRS